MLATCVRVHFPPPIQMNPRTVISFQGVTEICSRDEGFPESCRKEARSGRHNDQTLHWLDILHALRQVRWGIACPPAPRDPITKQICMGFGDSDAGPWLQSASSAPKDTTLFVCHESRDLEAHTITSHMWSTDRGTEEGLFCEGACLRINTLNQLFQNILAEFPWSLMNILSFVFFFILSCHICFKSKTKRIFKYRLLTDVTYEMLSNLFLFIFHYNFPFLCFCFIVILCFPLIHFFYSLNDTKYNTYLFVFTLLLWGTFSIFTCLQFLYLHFFRYKIQMYKHKSVDSKRRAQLI